MSNNGKSTNAPVHIVHRIGIRAAVTKVYEALSTIQGIAGWWSEDTSGVSKPGNTIVVRFLSPQGEELGSMKPRRIIPPSRDYEPGCLSNTPTSYSYLFYWYHYKFWGKKETGATST